MKKIPVIIILLSISQIGSAATDHYDSTGKLFTVIACVVVILIGIALFLFYLERRIAKMEQSLDDD